MIELSKYYKKSLISIWYSNPRLKQIIGLFSVNLIGIPIGIITSIALTRYLGPDGFGDYKFIFSIFNFAIIIFTFGFFQAGNRALVLNHKPQTAREYYGTELIITGALFIIMSTFLIFYGLYDQNLHEKNLTKTFFLIIPFGWIFLLSMYFETLFHADNRIRMLAQVRLYPKIGFLILAIVIYFAFANLKVDRLKLVWFIYLFTEVVVYTIILIKLKISFQNLQKRLLEIWHYNQSFGFNVYLGSLFAIGLSRFTEILISYYGIDNTGVGFYSLALTFTLPLSLIPNTIATTHYKDFATLKHIPIKVLRFTTYLSLVSLIGIWLIVPLFVNYFYGSFFKSVIPLNFIVSIGVIAHGFGDLYNKYLGANGQGVILRNSSFFVGVSMLLFSLILIPKWGEYGAAIAKMITGFVYLIVIIYFYYRFIKTKK